MKKYFWKSAKSAEELLNKEFLRVLKNLETFKISKSFKGITYEMTKKGNSLTWKFSDELSTFTNRAEISEYGFVEYNFKIPDKLLKKPYGGFGQQFLDESFEIFGDSINGAKASWNENPNYPGGSSLGHKQFWEVYNKTQNKSEALKGTTFYKTMSKKGISKITEKSVDIDEYDSVAPPIYKKTSIETIRKFQKMADKDGFDENNGPSTLGVGSLFLNKITPAFDDFNPPAKVTDDQFRIDLPLLMLYLDKHKINKNKCSPSLKNYLILNNNPDGLCSINDKCKDIIRAFVV